MQDLFSKFCIGVPLIETSSATIADALIKRLICVYGAPKVILTDQGRNLISQLMKCVTKRFKIKQIQTTAWHPQANGSLEKSHSALGEFLKQYSTTDSEWDEWVDIAIFNYNTCVQESTKFSPFEVLYGYQPSMPSSEPLHECEMLPTYGGYVKDLVSRIIGIRKIVYDNLVKSKYKSKKYYDKKLNEVNFRVGDFVFLLSGPKPKKLGDQYTGPFKILEVMDQHRIKIKIDKKEKIVNANRLKISHIHSSK